MIIVPVAGDLIKTIDDIPFKVVSYTNYKTEGPAVLATPASDGETVPIFFAAINELNGKKVKLLKNGQGYKVFDTDGYIKRKHQLPQPDSIIESDFSGVETRKYKVGRIRIHVPNQLASGMMFDVEDLDDKSKSTIQLSQITNIPQSLFRRKDFLAYYSDYTAKGTA